MIVLRNITEARPGNVSNISLQFYCVASVRLSHFVTEKYFSHNIFDINKVVTRLNLHLSIAVVVTL